PPLPPSGSVDLYFRLNRPAPDHKTTLMISDKNPVNWPAPKIITPPVAIAGGTIIGTVTNPNNQPVPGTYVSCTSTLTGTVENIKTDEKGRFKFKVPARELIMIAAVGLSTKIKRKIVPADKLDFPEKPSEFIEPGKDCTLLGNYPVSEYNEEENGRSHVIPEARTISKDGKKALTTLTAPPNLFPGAGTWRLTDTGGETHRFQCNIYRVTSARIDNRNLHSGQNADVDYEFDFGEKMANREVMIEPKITGPIQLIGQRGRRSVRIADAGHATFTFTVRARRVVPGKKIQFTIKVVISNPGRNN
ncbi:MAG: carboxypeptidase regulatory-like domain-containing protein, partial [bacterium]|nr:carboxypeptidase regulatory-like domain-containing protein [bacterium]